MKKKNLIVSGCSFTEGHILGKKGSWATYLSNIMGLKLHNQAGGGMSNSFISTSVIGHLTQYRELIEDSIVVIGWTDLTRMLGTFTPKTGGIGDVITIRNQDFIEDGQKTDWNNDSLHTYHGYVAKYRDVLTPLFSCWNYAVYETYTAMLNLKNFLELHKIPYLFFDAIADNKVIINNGALLLKSTNGNIQLDELLGGHMACILNQRVIDKIFNDKNYISFYGHTMDSYMLLDPLRYKEYTKGNSGHPNEYASNTFAKLILDEYVRLYMN